MDSNENNKGGLSRRAVLARGALAAGAVATMDLLAAEANAQVKKATQAASGYQASPKGNQQCDNCRHWAGGGVCKVVEGSIAAAGWCRLYAKK
ncbi:high-potential iron-sulfur protein [Bradyrhizobium sp.]|uniref:high-potential iron-sulfur protein n=1 Tax=Bradyrhizobium sp. TaxID=376 RepID=UPI0025B9C95F|nr:high-potential iron-sulfur protein [Bradyrhizobium sp.]